LKRITNVHAHTVGKIAVSASGRILVSCGGGNNSTVKVMNTDLELQQNLQCSINVWSVAISPNSMMIVSGAAGGEVKI